MTPEQFDDASAIAWGAMAVLWLLVMVVLFVGGGAP